MEKKAAAIRLVILDVDGVLTDGRILINDRGEESKSLSVKDGLGLKMLMQAGIEVILITGRRSSALDHRAGELGIDGVYQGVSDKAALCKTILEEKGLRKAQTCSVGDDLPDLAMFSETGLAVAVADASPEVKAAADLVTVSRGGFGAVRELCERLLKCQGKWEIALAEFAGNRFT